MAISLGSEQLSIIEKGLNPSIKIAEKTVKTHSKASEKYVHVIFSYPKNIKWDGWVPIEYRRTGLNIETTEELVEYLNNVYSQMNPDNYPEWLKEQEIFWKDKVKAAVTKGFFDELKKGGWKCVECSLPKNPNWARRIQDLKEMGYTMATDTNRYCPNCKQNKTHLIMLPIQRGSNTGNGYETWSPSLRKRIVKVLGGVDVYENTKNAHCLPDHKFSEIRWDDDTLSENPDDMTDDEIREKFQLLSNQRNQQKREVCRKCFQTGERGQIYGIPYYFEGDEKWDESIPKKGKAAEAGCVGCPWHDIEKWREELIKELRNKEKNDRD